MAAAAAGVMAMRRQRQIRERAAQSSTPAAPFCSHAEAYRTVYRDPEGPSASTEPLFGHASISKERYALLVDCPTAKANADGDSCTICLSAYADGETVKFLPCAHRFHGRCLRNWLGKSSQCPVCRFECCPEDADDRSHEQPKG